MNNLDEFSSRLVTLAGGSPGLRTAVPVTVQPTDLPATIDFISSDATLDRYNEIIDPAGWDLTNYLKNPVFQNSHQYGDITFTLGRALTTEIRTSAAGLPYLFQRIEFAVDANPVARIAFNLYAGGFLRGDSVGFIPRRWQNGGPGDPFTRRYLEQELLEVSAVSIPANPNALAMALRSGAIEKTDLQETNDLLRAICAAERLAPSLPHSSPLPEALHLAREIRNLLSTL